MDELTLENLKLHERRIDTAFQELHESLEVLRSHAVYMAELSDEILQNTQKTKKVLTDYRNQI